MKGRGIQLTNYEPDIKVSRDSSGRILSGLVIGDVLRQNQAIILALHQGELKEWPAVGCGVSDMLLDNDPLYWRTTIREQMEMDGQKVNSVKITNNGIIMDASYN